MKAIRNALLHATLGDNAGMSGVALIAAVFATVTPTTPTLAAAPLPPGEAEFVLALAPDNSPEGIAVDDDGTIYFSNRRGTDEGLVSEIIRIGDDGKRSILTTFAATDDPDANGVLGLAVHDGDVYAALDTRKAASHGVWRIFGNGGKANRLPGSEQLALPNGLTFDNSGNLFVTDSAGAIWRWRPEERKEVGVLWATHELLQPFADFDPIVVPLPDGSLFPVPLPGANGVAFVAPHHLYVANTERGLLLHLTIQPDGSAGTLEVAAGDPLNPYTPLLTVDGIAADSGGHIHAVVPGFVVLSLFDLQASPLVEIDPDVGTIAFTVTDPAVAFGVFHTPLSLAFGTLPGEEQTVYITNGALFSDLIPGPGPGIVRAGVNP